MQASLDGASLKIFIRALTCLAKYGDDVVIHATLETLSLSTTNSSMSAYCRFKYSKEFFNRYNIEQSGAAIYETSEDGKEEAQTVTGQLLAKPFLSIIKHHIVAKTVERCELSIVEGNASSDNTDDEDSLESKLVIRLFCKYGVIKTHRLKLLHPTSLLAPEPPDPDRESQLTIGPLALRDMMGHFAPARGPKSDPQLVWNFDESEVQIRSWDSSIDSRAASQLSTELTITPDEFEKYDVRSLPFAIAFHLREFDASVSYAESMSLALDLRFTDPAAPLFIDVVTDDIDTLFVISTTRVHSSQPSTASNQARQRALANNGTVSKKRARETSDAVPSTSKKSVKVVHRTELPSSRGSAPPRASSSSSGRTKEPLFLPSLSQLSFEDKEESSNSTLLDAMDVVDAYNANRLPPIVGAQETHDDQILYQEDEEDIIFEPTQPRAERSFKPLFDD